jgi:hypothetical protein
MGLLVTVAPLVAKAPGGQGPSSPDAIRLVLCMQLHPTGLQRSRKPQMISLVTTVTQGRQK